MKAARRSGGTPGGHDGWGVAVALLLSLAVPALAFADEWPEAARSAQVHYRDGTHDAAADAYREVIAAGDPRPELSFNLGNALFRGGSADSTRYAEALQTYQRAVAAGDERLRPAALYNAANTLVEMGQIAEAEKIYREVLRQDPRDDDARYNLELVQRMLDQQPPQEGESEQQQQEQQEQSDDPQEDGSQEQEQPQDERQDAPPDSSGGQDQPPDAEPPDEEPPSEPEEQESQTPEPPQGDQSQDAPAVTPEEALRELEKLEELERELLRQILKAKRRKVDVEKDW